MQAVESKRKRVLMNSVPPKGQCVCLSSLAGLGVNISFTLEMCMSISLAQLQCSVV